MAPKLSICIPAHAPAFPLLRRTLLCFDMQTSRDFEVVVAIDGPGRFEVPATSYSLSFVQTPRTDSPLPHRNHARNAAAAMAKGELLWFVDCDFLWDLHTVEHLLAAEHAPLSPVLVTIRKTPEMWLEDTRWDEVPPRADYGNMLRSLTVTGEEWSGYARRYRLNRGVVVEQPPEPMPEGFPLVRAADFEGFDERFLGRGGNKESYVVSLDDYRLLASARGYHQPHSRETQNETLTDHNQQMFRGMGGGPAPGYILPSNIRRP